MTSMTLNSSKFKMLTLQNKNVQIKTDIYHPKAESSSIIQKTSASTTTKHEADTPDMTELSN
jgi:hypothetical protein